MENEKIYELIIVPGDDEDDSIVFSPKLDSVMAIIDSIKMALSYLFLHNFLFVIVKFNQLSGGI